MDVLITILLFFTALCSLLALLVVSYTLHIIIQAVINKQVKMGGVLYEVTKVQDKIKKRTSDIGLYTARTVTNSKSRNLHNGKTNSRVKGKTK